METPLFCNRRRGNRLTPAQFALQISLLLGLGSAVFLLPARAGDEWQPITPDELKMTSEPLAPGAPAIYLYRQVDRDDTAFHEYNYVRIKVLTEEGRKYADIEIPFIKGLGNIHNLKARTIRPDGRTTDFDGKVYEKTVVKARGVKFQARTFTLPDVQPGTIVEYRYMQDWGYYSIYDSRWIVSGELFTRHARFSLKPSPYFPVGWSWHGLPPGTSPPKSEAGGVIRLEVNNIPALLTEEFMPPENELKSRVDFVYRSSFETDAETFWRKQGKRLNDGVESFIGKRKAMEQAVSQMVAPNDAPEVKLRKIYARVQQLRNIALEAEKTEQERKREKQKELTNVEEVWKRGYGDGEQITWLFLALVRAAGLEAYPVLVSRRSHYFFNSKEMNTWQLETNVVLVKLNGKDTYYDPGTAFTPFGLLPWGETGVQGRRLDKEGGSWVTTPIPGSSVSRIERKADLKLTDQGSLEGKLTVTFTGLEALRRRMEERHEDEASRRKFLEDEMKEYIPAGIDVELKNKPDWSSSEETLVAEYDLKVPGWASVAGRRSLLPVGLFGGPEKHVFEHANRVHPIYFSFPFQKNDDVTIQLPAGWQATSLPPAQNRDAKVCAYTITVENKGGALRLTRRLNMDMLLLPVNYYGALRDFFRVVRTGDEQPVVLQPGRAAATN